MKKEESQYDAYIRQLLLNQKDAFIMNLSNAQILSADFLKDEFTKSARKNLTNLFLANNMLVTLNLCCDLPLTTLDASHNCLTNVTLALHSLQHLDLSFNSLAVMPKLVDMKYLEDINLSRNYLTSIDVKEFPRTLIDINLSSNLIEIDENIPNFLEVFCAKFKRFKSIKKLNLLKNPFVNKYPESINQLKAYCPNLTEIAVNESLDSPIKKVGFEKIEDGAQPRLPEMRSILLNAKKSPTISADELGKVIILIEKAQGDPIVFDASFDEKECNSFFEDLDALHSNQHKNRKLIYTVLTKLIYVKKMCSRAIETLLLYMKASPESLNLIESTLEKLMIRELTKDAIDTLPQDILCQLTVMAKSINISNLLRKIVRPFAKHLVILKGMPDYCDNNRDVCKNILGVLAAAFQNNTVNVNMIVKLGYRDNDEEDFEDQLVHPEEFGKAIKFFLGRIKLSNIKFEGLLKECEVHTFILSIIESCTKLCEEGADIFYRLVCQDLLSYLRISQQFYSTAYKEDDIDPEQLKKICIWFSNEITCMSTILRSDANRAVEVTKDTAGFATMKQIISVLLRAKIDPFILSSLCELALVLFENEFIIENEKVFFDRY